MSLQSELLQASCLRNPVKTSMPIYRHSRGSGNPEHPKFSWTPARARCAGLAGMTLENMQQISETTHRRSTMKLIIVSLAVLMMIALPTADAQVAGKSFEFAER